MPESESTQVGVESPRIIRLLRQALVGLSAGAAFGVLLGAATGALAMALSVFITRLLGIADYTSGSYKGPALMAMGVGAVLGLLIGSVVGMVTRLVSTAVLSAPFSSRGACCFGGTLGVVLGIAVYGYWHPSHEAVLMLMILSAVIGACAGGLAVAAKPAWADG